MSTSNQLPVIYLVDGSLAHTGAFACARNFARTLVDHAHVVLVIPRQSALAAQETSDFHKVIRLPIRNLRRSIGSVLLYVPSLLISSLILSGRMKRDQTSFLIANDFYLMQVPISRLFGFRGRIVTWVRIDPAVFGRVSSFWLWAVTKSSDRIVAVSSHIKNLLPLGLNSEIIYDAIDSAELDLDVETNPSTQAFVFVGNYIRGKGQDIAVEALSLVVQEFADARIEFYGGDMGLNKNKEFRRSLEIGAAELGLSENVFFGNFVRDPKSVLTGKLAALNLSRSESFSLTVLEASACGLPVIATRSGGPQEILEDDATGYLIPVDDVEACAKAMIQLCRFPEKARAMGEAGRTRVRSKFSQEAYKRKLFELLEIDA